MAILVGEVDSENDAEGKARKPEGTLPQVLNHRINWFVGAKYKYQYKAYLVQVSDLTQTSVTFQFVNCNSGNLVGTSHRVDLSDFSKVYPFNPSTLPTPAELAVGNNVSFLLLNSMNLGELQADADLSAPDDGKWPRVTAEERLQDENTKLKAALRRLLEMVEVKNNLPPQDWGDFQNLVGGGFQNLVGA